MNTSSPEKQTDDPILCRSLYAGRVNLLKGGVNTKIKIFVITE